MFNTPRKLCLNDLVSLSPDAQVSSLVSRLVGDSEGMIYKAGETHDWVVDFGFHLCVPLNNSDLVFVRRLEN